MSEQKSNTNDHALAHALNRRAWQVLWYVADLYPLCGKDLEVVNRNYIALTHELEKLYNQNKELQDIEPKPAWQRFNLIDGNEPHIVELQDDRTGDTGQSHTAKVKRLCIIAGVEEPILTQQQKELIVETDKIIATLAGAIDEEQKHTKAIQQKHHDVILEYTFNYDELRGQIIINDIYRINKRSTNDGSNIDNILKQAKATPYKLFEPTLNSTSKNVISILSSAGLDETIRQLFFLSKRKSKNSNKKLYFRPRVTRAEADAEDIDTKVLDVILKEEGADTTPAI